MKEFLEFIQSTDSFSTVVSYASILLAVIFGFGLRAYRNVESLVLHIFSVLAIVFAIIEVYVLWILNAETIWVHNTWVLIENVCLLLFFIFLLRDYSRYLIALGLALIGLELFYLIGYSSFEATTSMVTTIRNSFFIVLAILGYFELFVKEEEPDLLRSPRFWFLSGILVYMTGSLFSFMLSEQIITSDSTAIMGMWHIHNIFNAMRYLFFAMGFLMVPKWLLVYAVRR